MLKHAPPPKKKTNPKNQNERGTGINTLSENFLFFSPEQPHFLGNCEFGSVTENP